MAIALFRKIEVASVGTDVAALALATSYLTRKLGRFLTANPEFQYLHALWNEVGYGPDGVQRRSKASRHEVLAERSFPALRYP